MKRLHHLVLAFSLLTLPATSFAAPVAGPTTTVTTAAAPAVAAAKAVAGYDKGFFLGSADGRFRLRANLEAQLRYVGSHLEDDAAAVDDDNIAGFQTRRARIDLRGHAFTERLSFRLRSNADRASGSFGLDYAYLAYDLDPRWKLKIGQFKPFFLREEYVNGFHQMAVERSYVADYLTVDVTQGIEATYQAPRWRTAFALHDGSYAPSSDYTADRSTYPVSARFELLASGGWKQFEDFAVWTADPHGILVGLGIDYETGDLDQGGAVPNLLKATLDLSAELGRASLFVALTAQRLEGAADNSGLPATIDGITQYSSVAQASWMASPDRVELFARYEYLDFDGFYYRNNGNRVQTGTGAVDDDTVGIAAVGATWYVYGQGFKLSLDVQHSSDAVPVSNTGGGLLGTAEGQTAVRFQTAIAF